MSKSRINIKHCILILTLLLLIASCTKEEGEGGNSVITGKIFVEVYNNTFTHLLNSFYKPEVDVYIIYGNNTIYNDRFKTNWDGSYRFEYLRKGNYKIYAYSVDISGGSISGLTPVIQEIDISNNNTTVTVDDLVILEKCDYDDGTSGITGKIYILDYNEERTVLLDEYYGADEDVYIVYADDPFYFMKIQTHYDGTFQFQNLVKGTYTIYALSKDMINKTSRELIPIKRVVTISEDFQHEVVQDIIIVK